jgi:TolB-like protein
MFRLELLGGFRWTKEGRELPLKSRKGRALLSYLALHPRACEARHRLAALLWGDAPDSRARSNLRDSLSSLRRAGASTLLHNDGDLVRLDLDQMEVDALELVRLSSSTEASELKRITTLWQGELLADLSLAEDSLDEWLREQRFKTRKLADGLFSKWARKQVQLQDLEAAEQALLSWLEFDPGNEEAHRNLMEVYRDSGRRAQAVEQFERCRKELEHGYGVTPGEVTRQLHRSICEGPTTPTKTELRGPLSLPSRPTVAVLPFEDRSEEKMAWFVEGIAEDIIVKLSKFDSLWVLARQSSFVLRSRGMTHSEIARDLGVHYLLDGSVRRAGDRLRVTVQLVRAETGATVWGHRYDGTVEELFDFEDDVTQRIVATLVGRVEADHQARRRDVPTTNVEAYDLLLRGKYHHHAYSAEDNAMSQDFLRQAIELAPEFALPYAWLACVLAQGNAFNPDATVFDRCYVLVKKARELEDGDSECHRILAAYYLIQRRFEESGIHQQRALQLNPHDDRIVCQMGELLTYFGRSEEALEWIEKAIRLNPYHPDSYLWEYGRALYDVGRWSEGLAALRRIGKPRPTHHAFMIACCLRLDDPEGMKRHLSAFEAGNGGALVEVPSRLPYRDAKFASAISQDLAAAMQVG